MVSPLPPPRHCSRSRPSSPSALSSPFPSSSSSQRSRSTTASHRKRRPKHYRYNPPTMLVFLSFIVLLLSTPARAVLIQTFDNCLSRTVRDSPSHLQFHPLVVAASFGTEGDRLLQVTVWGNVTGASSADPGQTTVSRRSLIASDDTLYRPRRPSGWSWWEKRQNSGVTTNNTIPLTHFEPIELEDPGIDGDINYLTTGEIVDIDPGWGQNIATTLNTKIMIASFTALSNKTFFCDNTTGTGSGSEIAGGTCPMSSVSLIDLLTNYNLTLDSQNQLIGENISLLLNDLPSFSWERTLPSDYNFATLDTTFTIITGDVAATTVGCVHIELTPVLAEGNGLALTWVPIGILALVALATILAAILNPWTGTTDVFRWSSNYGMDEDMIRLVTPGFADCLQWLQFLVLTGGLSLNYPGFYQPAISKIAWSVLLLNTSFYTHDPVSAETWMADGLYALDSNAYGYERLAQAVGLQSTNDIWTCVAAWFAVLIIGTFVFVQLWFWVRWGIRRIMVVEEEDLTMKNWPFAGGMLNRFTFTYFITPVLAASSFQLTVASNSSTALVGIASVLIFMVIGISIIITHRIWNTTNHSALFDNLRTLLTYGTFYNTFREKSLVFFIVQLYVNMFRGLVFGAAQPSGIAQVSLLAICEIVLILAIYGMQPYAPATSMNAWQTALAFIRLITILLMMAFIPSMDANDAAKGWIGYIILAIHGLVLIFGFFFMAIQTLLELLIRGCGGVDDGQDTRGGLTKVFGMRQLSRRKHHQSVDPSINTLVPTEERKLSGLTGSSRPGMMRPMSRSGSSAVLLGGAGPGSDGMELGIEGGSQSGHGHSNSGSTGFTPTTPGAFSYLPGPNDMRGLALDTGGSTAGPYYRPPRPRGVPRTGEGSESEAYSPGAKSRGSWGSEAWATSPTGRQRSSQGSFPPSALGGGVINASDDWDIGGPSGTGTPPATSGGRGIESAHRHTESITAGSNRGNTDYAVREVDFYYGVRGPALSRQPAPRLGTGPADPMGPVAVVKGWLMRKLGFGGKEEKGFTVVRSSRAPEALMDAEREAKGIGLAVSTPDDGEQAEPEQDSSSEDDSSDSESEEVDGGARKAGERRKGSAIDISDSEESDGDEDTIRPANIRSPRALEKQPVIDKSSGIEMMRQGSKSSNKLAAPKVPRKSSKRKSASLLTPIKTHTSSSSNINASPPSPDSPIKAHSPNHLYDPHIHRHTVSTSSATSRLPFSSSIERTTSTRGRGMTVDTDQSHSRSISTTSSSILQPPPAIDTDEGGGSRPASMGEVQRYRMEDSLRTVSGDGERVGSQAELVDRSESMTSDASVVTAVGPKASANKQNR